MALTKRARKRLLLLIVIVGVAGALLAGVRLLQEKIRDDRAEIARERGIEAMQNGDWDTAIVELRLVVSRDNRDIEAILMLAEARLQVPAQNSQQLQRTMNLFLRADEIAEETDASDDLKITALEGRGRIEALLNQVARLRDSSLRLLEIDPDSTQALQQLLAVSEVTGDLLPSDPRLVIRGDRTTESWLEAMRDAEDQSSLRWVLEQFVADPNSSENIFNMLTLLQRGEADNRQEARLGRVVEDRLSLLARLSDEYPGIREDIKVLQAREWLVDNGADQARSILEEIDIDLIRSPQIKLLASAIYNSFGTVEGRAEGNRILEIAASGVGDDVESRIRIAIQMWQLDEAAKSLSLVEEGLKGLSAEDPGANELLILACQIGILNQELLSEERRQALEASLSERSISPVSRGRIDLLLKVNSLRERILESSSGDIRQEGVKPEISQAVTVLCGNFSSSMNDPLMLCVLADLASMVGLDVIASSGFQDALDSTGGTSAPISRRLISSYARQEAYLRAFKTAANYLRQYQTRYAAAIFAEAWINLERMGLQGIDYEPWIAELGTPAEFLLRLPTDAGDGTALLKPVLARALHAEGRLDEARDILLESIAEGTDPKARLRYLNTMSRLAYEIPGSVFESMLSQVNDDSDRIAIIRVQLAQLERSEGAVAAMNLLKDLPTETRSKLRRLENLIVLRASLEAGESTSGAFDEILATDVSERDLASFMRIAAESGDRESAERLFSLAVGTATEKSLTAGQALVAAIFVVNFDLKNPESLNSAIRMLDPLVSSGNSTSELEFLYAQILRNSGDEKMMLAIDLLRSSVSRSPERFSSSLLLCEMLQDTIQFEESGEILRDLTRRTRVTTEAQQAKLIALLSRQGEMSRMADSICDIAERTGQISSVLRCIDAKRLLGELEEADRLLDGLSVREDRTGAVELELARRIQSRGDAEAGLEYLEQSDKFESNTEKSIAIAEFAHSAGKWGAVISKIGTPDAAIRKSAKAQLLLATACLKSDPADVEKGFESLRLAVELEPENGGVLRRAALIAIEAGDFPDERSFFLDRLESVDEAQADLLRLGIDLSTSRSDPDADWDLLATRSSQIVEKLQNVPVAWQLRLDVLSAASQAARFLGDPDALERFNATLLEDAQNFVSRFPRQSSPLSRQAKILLSLGRPEEAILVARACLDVNVETVRVGTVIDLARAEFQLGNYQRVVDVLGGFTSLISSNSERFPAAWNLLFRSLLLSGDVDTAFQIYMTGAVVGTRSTNWDPWVSTIEQTEPRIALEATRMAVENTVEPRGLLVLSAGLNRLYQDSGDPAIAAFLEQLNERIDAMIAGMPESEDLSLLRFQIAAAEVEAAALSDPRQAVVEALVVFRSIPGDSLLSREVIDSLANEERRNAEAFFAAYVIFLNNLVARSGSVIERGDLSDKEVSELKAAADSASAYLLSVLPENPDILDSIADYKSAVGDISQAIELIKRAISLTPGRPVFYVTYARVLCRASRFDEAQVEVEKASRLLRAVGADAPEIYANIDRVIEQIESAATPAS